MHADPIPGPDFVAKARIGRGFGWGVAGAVFLLMAALLYLGGDATIKGHENLWLALGVLFAVIGCATGLAGKIEARLMDIQREIARGNQLRSDEAARRLEGVLLRSRIADGLAVSELTGRGRHAIASLIADGLIDGPAALRGRVVLTLRGRLLADAVVRALTE